MTPSAGDEPKGQDAADSTRGLDARTSAILETALDCIITMDSRGNVVEFNPAAERTFGYRRADALGRELASLIIPPAMRDRHRRGLAHYLASGEAPVLGRRVELDALRADGVEFPVELAITRIPGEPALFTAYLRDISQRVRIEQLRNVRFAVTNALAQATDIQKAAVALLQSVCTHLNWQFGAFWSVEDDSVLRCHASWAEHVDAIARFEGATREMRLAAGEGLPGRVLASVRAEWIPDVLQEDNFPRRAAAAAAGLHSAFACPLVVGERTLGVIEFFTQRFREPDSDLLETMATIAGHFAQFVERREAEHRLQQSEARFRALMDQAPFSMQVFSGDGRTVRVNQAWSQLWGVTLEEIAGYNVLEDAQLEQKGVLPILRRAFAGEAVVLPPIRYDPQETIPGRSHHEEPARHVAAVAYPLKDETGRVVEVVLVHEDITARRRAETALRDSEERLRLLVDTIPQLAWMARPDGHIFWYNKRWYEYTDTTPQQMEGWGWQSVHDPVVLPEVLERWSQSIATGQPFDMIFPLRGFDGVFRQFLTRVNPLRDSGGGIVYWFGTNTDVSEIKRLEQALRDADRRKDEFIAMLSHELRNPLAPVRNALQILKMPGVDERAAQRARDIMERQVEHMVRLIDDLLDVSRVVRGKIELRRQAVGLAAVVARAVETVQPVIDAQDHRLDVLDSPQPLVVDGDPVRLAQVVGNLLNNAAKYTPLGGTIKVHARQEGAEAVLTVRDNGIGIAEDALQHIFDLFVQVPQTSPAAQGGLGIGLTLVKEIVEMHGGTVRAHSAGLGTGSEFTIRLPLLDHMPT